MFETKYSKFLTVLLIIIIIAILGLVGYLGYSYYKEYSMKKDSEDFVSGFIDEQAGNQNLSGDGSNLLGSISSADIDGSGSAKTYKGYEIIGTIEIPKIDITYPVYQTPPTPKKLELSVSAVYPATAQLNVPGNVVISGHNYRNGSFFSNTKKLAEGDKIYLTDLDGNRVTYTVKSVFTTTKDEVSFYNRDTDGNKEVTLTTCADDSTEQRVIVQARAEE